MLRITGIQKARYLNSLTDFGFKKLFGEEYNKELLIDFLNQLLEKEQGRIKSLTYMKNEYVGRSEWERRAIFDLYYENEKCEKFWVVLGKSHFEKLFRAAEISKFTDKEASSYEDSLKVYRDMKNSLDTAMEKGLAKGRAKGRAEGFEKGRKKKSWSLQEKTAKKKVSL